MNWESIREKARALNGDGCTNAPDLQFRDCCDLHDIMYRTGKTPCGRPVTRAEADRQLRRCMRQRGGVFLPWLYWGAVRAFGFLHWNKELDGVIDNAMQKGVQS